MTLKPKKTAEEIAKDIVDDTVDSAIKSGGFNRDDVIRWMVDAIEADRAQRELDDNSPETHEFVVTVSECTFDEADKVMNERISYEEDYGFPYEIGYRNR